MDESRGLSTLSLCFFFSRKNFISLNFAPASKSQKGDKYSVSYRCSFIFKYLCDVTNGLLVPVGLYRACVYSRAMIM